MLISFKNRSEEEEYMDDPDLNPKDLEIALQDISRVNRLLGGNQITIDAIDKRIRNFSSKKEFIIMDVGCGDGEMLRRIADFYRNKQIKLKLIGIDLNIQCINRAIELSTSYPDIEFRNENIFDLKEDLFSCDLIISTLTFHHFNDDQIIKTIEKCLRLSSIAIIVNDLHRSFFAYYLFKLFSNIFIKGYVAKADGLLSVRRGFKKKELHQYARKIHIRSYTIKWKWAFRYLWEIDI